MISVVIVDDEALLRSALSMIVAAAPDIDVLATADATSAIPVISTARPDVVLLDIRMPERDGLSILREIRRRGLPSHVVMLTTFDADEYIAEALEEGARGFLLKDTEPDDLQQFIRAVAGGGVVLGASVGRRVVSGLGSARPSAGEDALIARLTPRELLVLQHAASGLGNAEIGERIHLSVGTVKDHMSSVLTKLGVSTRVQAVLIAERSGVLSGPSTG